MKTPPTSRNAEDGYQTGAEAWAELEASERLPAAPRPPSRRELARMAREHVALEGGDGSEQSDDEVIDYMEQVFGRSWWQDFPGSDEPAPTSRPKRAGGYIPSRDEMTPEIKAAFKQMWGEERLPAAPGFTARVAAALRAAGIEYGVRGNDDQGDAWVSTHGRRRPAKQAVIAALIDAGFVAYLLADGDVKVQDAKRVVHWPPGGELLERCGCLQAVERLLVPGSRPTMAKPPRIKVDRKKLRAIMGAEASLIEKMDLAAPTAAAVGSGRPKANTAVMWRYFTTSVYQSGDLPVLAIRETLQNAIDAVDAAVAARQIRRADGFFRVEWDEKERTLTVEDNGIGMDPEVFFDKFLTIGETGKGAGLTSSQGGKGGFGVAKAVILGTASMFRWKMHTRDNLFVANGFEEDVQHYKVEPRQGTALVLYDVDHRFDRWYDYAQDEYVSLTDRIALVLGVNDLDGINLSFQGKAVPRLFSRRGGAKVAVGGSWGPGTTATIKAYKRGPGDRRGGYYVRLDGLWQFSLGSQRHGLKADVVVDVVTTVRPGNRDYPLNAARDAFTDQARDTFLELVATVEQEDESVGSDREYVIFDPESDDATEREDAANLAEQTWEAMNDPEVRDSIKDALGGIADYYAEQVRYDEAKAKRTEQASDAPAGSREHGEPVVRRPIVLPDGFVHVGKGASGEAGPHQRPAEEGRAAPLEVLVQSVEDVLGLAERRARVPESIVDDDVRSALREAVTGDLGTWGAGRIQRALLAAADSAMGPGGGGLVEVAEISQAMTALAAMMPEEKRQRQPPRNPFGKYAGLRISKRNYDRQRAYRFRKSYGRWMPYLIAWDAALRLVAAEARIRVRFAPGFVLDDEVGGLCASGNPPVIYIHPDRFAAVVKARKDRPLAVAHYLHNVAVHELAHLDGRMGEGHSESYVAAREDLGTATGHLLPAIAVIVSRVLHLAGDDQKVRAQLVALQAEVKEARKALRSCSASEVDRRAVALLEAVGDALTAQPPPGVSSAYVVGFLARNRKAMLAMLRKAMGGRRG